MINRDLRLYASNPVLTLESCEQCGADSLEFKPVVLKRHICVLSVKPTSYHRAFNFMMHLKHLDYFTQCEVDEMTVCQSCESNANYCDETDTYTLEDTYTVYDDCGDFQAKESVLDRFECCPDCGDYNTDDNMRSVSDGPNVCSSCADDRYYYCEGCGMYSNEDLDDNCCENCGWGGNDEESCEGLIYSYDYTPHFDFYGKSSKKEPYLGTEIEIESKEDRQRLAEVCHEHFNRSFMKNDGSLDNGFEVVSMPMTLEEHLNNGTEIAMQKAVSYGGRSHDTSTCGLHVHVSKEYMTEGHKVRFGMFFSLCQSQLTVLARRNSEQWSRFKETGLAWNRYKESERYEAVNWTNRNTVEVRIFKGTLKYSTYAASLELVHAIYNFTLEKHCFSVKLNSKKVFNRLLKFITKENKISGRYSYLINYLRSKSFLNESEEQLITA